MEMQTDLGIWLILKSSVSAWRRLGSLATHKAHSEAWSDWVDAQAVWSWSFFAGRTGHFVGVVMLWLGVWGLHHNFLHTCQKFLCDCLMLGLLAGVCEMLFGPGHAKTCLMPYANNKGADQPAHPRSLISTFIVCFLDSMICILAISKVARF